jgi:hypothetical protein
MQTVAVGVFTLAYRCRGSTGFEPVSRFTRVEHLVKAGLYTSLVFIAFFGVKGLSMTFVIRYTHLSYGLKKQIRKSLGFS